MQITIKLYAMLSKYLPPDAVHNVSHLEVVEAASVGTVLEQLRLPRELVHLVLLNGVYISPPQHQNTVLKEADVLAVWPPVAGG